MGVTISFVCVYLLIRLIGGMLQGARELREERSAALAAYRRTTSGQTVLGDNAHWDVVATQPGRNGRPAVVIERRRN